VIFSGFLFALGAGIFASEAYLLYIAIGAFGAFLTELWSVAILLAWIPFEILRDVWKWNQRRRAEVAFQQMLKDEGVDGI
jgi:hypothetical protein